MIERRWLGTVVASLGVFFLGACANDAGPNEPGSPGDPGSAQIGASGGTVEATLTGGGSLVLAIPAGALTDTVTITLEPLAPTGAEHAAFRVTPGGLAFKVPATFTATLPSGATLDPTVTIAFDRGPLRIPLAATVDQAGRRVVVQLTQLWEADEEAGPPAGPSRSASAGGPATGAVLSMEYVARAQMLIGIGVALQSMGSFDNAFFFNEILSSIVVMWESEARADPLIVPAMAEMRRVTCDQYDFELRRLADYDNPGGVAGLVERARQVSRWGRLALEFGDLATAIGAAACSPPPPDPAEQVNNKVVAFLPAMRAEFEQLDAIVFFDTLMSHRVRPLVNLLQDFHRDDAFEPARMGLTGMLSDQFVRMREAAFSNCRTTTAQGRQHDLMVAEHDVLLDPLSPYEELDIIRDVGICGFGVTWAARDAGGVEVRSGTFGGDRPGVAAVRDTLTMGTGQSLRFSGAARPLSCPAGRGDGGSLLVTGRSGIAAPTTLLTRPAGAGYFASPQTIPVSALQAVAGIPSGGFALVVVEVRRTGDTCDFYFGNLEHDLKYTLEIQLSDTVRITTTQLPNGEVNAAYSQTLTAIGGTGGYMWSISAGALPGGLSLGASTGVISGTPSGAGTFNFTATVQSGPQSYAAPLSITIAPPPPPPLQIETTNLTPGFVGVPYSATLSASGGPGGTTVWSVSSGLLPPGLTLTGSTISGVPQRTDTVNLGIRATQGSQTATATLILRIQDAPLRVVTTFIGVNLPDKRFTPTLPLSVGLQASGGTGGPYTWSLVSGLLPVGATMSTAGVISGNVSDPGTPTITVRVSDGVGSVEATIEVRYVCCFF